jgi:hypothetical protein
MCHFKGIFFEQLMLEQLLVSCKVSQIIFCVYAICVLILWFSSLFSGFLGNVLWGASADAQECERVSDPPPPLCIVITLA